MKLIKRAYTRDEKIEYYTKRLLHAKKKLEYLQSEEYQDWNSDLLEELKELRQKNADLIEAVKKEKGA